VRPLVLACALLAATAAEARLIVVNATGFNLPELQVQAELALEDLLVRAGSHDVRLTVDLLDVTDLRDRNVQPFPFSARHTHPRGFIDGFGGVRVEGTLEVLRPDGEPGAHAHRFRGRAAAFQDREPALSESRGRRPFAGFLAVPGRLDPLGPLVVRALANGVRTHHVDRWFELLVNGPE
jgi:hypothetical protein